MIKKILIKRLCMPSRVIFNMGRSALFTLLSRFQRQGLTFGIAKLRQNPHIALILFLNNY